MGYKKEPSAKTPEERAYNYASDMLSKGKWLEETTFRKAQDSYLAGYNESVAELSDLKLRLSEKEKELEMFDQVVADY